MLTIFSVPKPFTGLNDVAQHNALRSWLLLRPQCQVILCGDELGVAQVCEKFGLQHIRDVPVNEFGTPLLDQAFARVELLARERWICYINTDIILFSNFLAAVKRIPFERFLMTGRRWNLDFHEIVDFDQPTWELDLQREARERGSLQPPMGSDYFVFLKDSLGELLPFAVGRPGWDNWIIYRARLLLIPVIDATGACMVVHQNHDYSHVPERTSSIDYSGPEADHNLKIMGGNRTRFTLWDATHLLTENGVRRAWGAPYLRRRIHTVAALHPFLRPLAEQIKRRSSGKYRRKKTRWD